MDCTIYQNLHLNKTLTSSPLQALFHDGGMYMKYNVLGKTGLKVSEIGFGGEWLEHHPEEESIELMKYAGEKGINIIDCWMPDPKSRDIIGKAMKGNREKWYVQGHFGSTWQNGQYVRTRDMKYVKPAFEDLLTRLLRVPNKMDLCK